MHTRPRDFEGMEVPEVLLSGDHAKIRQWRREQSQGNTREAPDLLKDVELSEKEQQYLRDLRQQP